MNKWLTSAKGKHRAGIGAVIALVVALGFVAVLVAARNPSTSPAMRAIAPVVVSEAELRDLALRTGQPIYWAGPREGSFYELSRTKQNDAYVRYVPPGTPAGANGGEYLTVATFPFVGASTSLESIANGNGIELPGGGFALVDPVYASSVHLAFPFVDYQMEVYDPSPERARAIATSCAIE